MDNENKEISAEKPDIELVNTIPSLSPLEPELQKKQTLRFIDLIMDRHLKAMTPMGRLNGRSER
jgi:hypothetical protein